MQQNYTIICLNFESETMLSKDIKKSVKELRDTTKNLNVLFVDDEQVIRESFSQTLRMFFKEATVASCAKEALEIYSNNFFDLVISDINMPQMNGLEMVEIIKQKNPQQAIIMMTAFSESEYLLEAFQKEVEGYITKPFELTRDYEVLMSTAKKILAKKEEKETKKELEQSNKLYQETLHQYQYALDQSAIVSKTDLQGNITYVSDNFCETSGYNRAELLGKPHSIVRHPDVEKNFFKELWKTVASKKIYHGTIKNLSKDQKTYYVNSYIFPMLDQNGKPEGYFSIATDATNDVLIKEKEAELSSMKDTLILTMNHELKTPLNAIQGFSNLLSKKCDDPKFLQYIEHIKENADHMNTTVNRLSLLTQLKSKNYRSTKLKSSAKLFFEGLHVEYEKKAIDHNRQLVWNISLESTPITKDFTTLQMILDNLFDNALKFTKNGGLVTLSASQNPHTDIVDITIEDNGVGIAQEKLSCVFNPFSQEESSTSRSFNGLGLGLSLVQYMVEAINGEITVESTQGVGTIFTLRV